MSEQRIAEIRAVFTNEVIRSIGSLARQQNVCREQGGKAVFVTGMEAAREYIVEHISDALSASPAETGRASETSGYALGVHFDWKRHVENIMLNCGCEYCEPCAAAARSLAAADPAPPPSASSATTEQT